VLEHPGAREGTTWGSKQASVQQAPKTLPKVLKKKMWNVLNKRENGGWGKESAALIRRNAAIGGGEGFPEKGEWLGVVGGLRGEHLPLIAGSKSLKRESRGGATLRDKKIRE